MREIKFRGLRIDGKGWVYGDLVRTTRVSDGIRSEHSLIGVDMDFHEVIPETVGQYTGLKDKNGKEIYEGDILSDWTDTDEGMKQSHQQVFWCSNFGEWRLDSSFHQDKTCLDSLWQISHDYECEITGNIYENQ